MDPLLFYLREWVMTVTETWLQRVIDQEVEGVELVILEQVGSKRQKTIRLYIDHGDGVTHELCGKVSEVVGRALEEVDAIGGPYVLEVSSPGLERPLRKREHFEAQVGKKVYVKTRVPVEGSRAWQGTLVEVGGGEIVIDDEGRRVSVQLSDIGSAHLTHEFK
jgi:ribosome maturation factor RimP